MFQLDRVTRQFGGQVLFGGLTWNVLPGARVGLVGPNGAGKTTLMRLLAGFDTPDAGQVNRPRAARVGYLPQEVETLGSGSVLGRVLEGLDELTRIRDELARIEREMASFEPDDPRAEVAMRDYGELRHRLEGLDGDRVETRARRVLGGLGFSEASMASDVATLSGGWRMRVALARLLLSEPDLLLLDEPTNHLDLASLEWLEAFLASWAGAVVIVSHDRYFLNRMVRRVVELEGGRLTDYAGNYDAYLEARESARQAAAKAAKQQARDLAKTRRFIERFRYKNTRASLVQSRLRAMDKVERVEVKGETRRIRFGFPPAPRSGDIALRFEGVSKSFGARPVFGEVSLILRRGDRVALVGPNGAGKSTLLKLAAEDLEPDAGRVVVGHNIHRGFYAQHQLEALDLRQTVLESLAAAAPEETGGRLRTMLGSFLFTGDAVDKRVGVLSGGEKARLALARLLAHASNLLMLDEPTNHLDLESREVLEDALNEYEGSLLVVSHDRYFINRVATSVAEIDAGSLIHHDGDYDAYLAWKQARGAGDAGTAGGAGSRGDAGGDETPEPAPTEVAPAHQRREERRQAAEQRNRRYRERKEREARLAPIESEIAELESRIGQLTGQQAEPDIYSDPVRAAEVGREKQLAEERLERLYTAWADLAAELEDEP